jgi:hypothetical protein
VAPAAEVTAKKVRADRDNINGCIRVVARDPMKPTNMRIYWLTDDEARQFAAELLAAVSG